MKDEAPRTPLRGRAVKTLLLALTCGLLLLLGLVVTEIPLHSQTLEGASRFHAVSEDALHKSGVGNPVTAVLLNFRAYDTLLELAVVLLAVLSAQAAGSGRIKGDTNAGWQHNRMLKAAVAIIVPVSIVVAGDLLWMGADYPGGAFQAGAVLSGAGIMLIMAGNVGGASLNNWRYRLAAVAGTSVFVIVGLFAMANGNGFLQYPTGYAKTLILAIETAAMVSVAIVFVVLFDAVARLPDANDQRLSGTSREETG